jgi:archaeosortase A (PGF-CTERM-specific)
MLDALADAYGLLESVSQPIGWLAIFAFLAGFATERVRTAYARYLYTAGWLLFAVFWLSLVGSLYIDENSIVQGTGSLLAVPLSVLVARHIADGRESLFALSRAVGVMGLVYFPFLASSALRQPLIELVTAHTEWGLQLVGTDYQLISGRTVDGYTLSSLSPHPYESRFIFGSDGDYVSYTIILACTGIGSMAIFVGLISAVKAPLRRKARALALSLGIIYVLNIVRNVFIATSFGHQRLQLFPDLIMSLFSLQYRETVSFIWADRIISQFGAVIVLIGITYLVVREVPEVLAIIDELLYLVTGNEYDLQETLGVDRPEPEPQPN